MTSKERENFLIYTNKCFMALEAEFLSLVFSDDTATNDTNLNFSNALCHYIELRQSLFKALFDKISPSELKDEFSKIFELYNL